MCQGAFIKGIIRHIKAFLNWLCVELLLCNRQEQRVFIKLKIKNKRTWCGNCHCCCHFCCRIWSSRLLITEIIMLMLTALLAFLGSRCQRSSREPRHSAKCQPPPRVCVSVCMYVCWREMAWDKGELATSAHIHPHTCTFACFNTHTYTKHRY